MSKHQDKINELGGISMFNDKIKILVKEYNDAEKYLETLNENLQSASDEEKEAIQTDIQETQQALKDGDKEILKKVESYWKNRDGYIKRMQSMRDKLDAKRVAQGKEPVAWKQKPEPAPVVATAPAPQPKVQEAVVTEEAVITKSGGGETQVVTATPAVEEKKAEGFDNLIFWGVLGLAGVLIGVNLYKNRN
ncbi:MAG: hypothetical protein FJY17_00025 [Bacteroidetes bacterium]|nr:hypothetical protein [Bacteroidota bacterium]